MNKRLEELSDKVRQGIPINISDALEVIEYQTKKNNSFLYKLKKLLRII